MAANASASFYSCQMYSAFLWRILVMSLIPQSCYLCSEDESLPLIYLPDDAPITVGRSVATQINDTMCSKHQVSLHAKYADQIVIVKQIGCRASGLNGFKTVKNDQLIAKHDDCLELLYGKYKYRIEFNPPPEKNIQNIKSKKRDYELSSDNEEIDAMSGPEYTKKSKIEDVSGETTTQKNKVASANDISNDIKIADYSKETEPIEENVWEDINKELLVYSSKGVTGRAKIAAYDMDGTLIKTKSGHVFPKDTYDWQLLYSEVPGKLKELHNDGYKIVIFTNQAFLSLGKWKPSDFKQKIERIVTKIGIPMQVFIATGKSLYRKPLTGMWDTLVNDKNNGVRVDKESSFFVGDAAGRPKDWAPKKKKDHSSADRLLALNLNLKFETPEEHFLGQKPVPWGQPKFDPKSLDEHIKLTDPPSANIVSGEQEVVVLVGGPGSGKSHFASTHLPTYSRINRDTLGSWQKCISALEKALSEGKSAVIDNTNPSPTVRQKYIDVAKARGIPVRCFMMSTDIEHARHNNKFRQLTDSSHDVISDAILYAHVDTKSQIIWRCVRFVKLLLLLILRIYVHYFLTRDEPYRKNFQPPALDEGYTEIVNINFVPKFKNEEEKKLYKMYLLEK